MVREITYSAKFKRDYVAALAIIIFFAIVLAEIALAISIPSYLKSKNAMALQTRRLQMLESFDTARAVANRIKIPDTQETAELELRLVKGGLNTLAPYLRKHADELSSSQITELQTTIREMTRILVRIRDVGSYSHEQTLDSSIYIESLLPEGKP